MVVHTDNPRVRKARKGVLEFLLLNHPLDCPVCDKAGECKLQDFYFEFSGEDSRLTHQKWHKRKKKVLGKNIVLDQERCILCGRCVRFMDNVAKEPVLGRFGRGNRTVIDCFPGESFDSVYSMNTVDICPVGALTSRDFRFKQRTWFLEKKDSVCPHCSTGCTIRVEYRNNKVYRIVPQTNMNININWMCDHGRLSYHQMEENRVEYPGIRRGDSIEKIRVGKLYNRLKDEFFVRKKGDKFAIICSYYLTNEEAFLTYKLAEQLRAPVIILEKKGGLIGEENSDEFLLSRDKTPNRIGIERIGSAFSKVRTVMGTMIDDYMAENSFTHTILVGVDLTSEMGEKAYRKIESTNKLALSYQEGNFVSKADYLIPTSYFFEKSGSFINKDGYIQKFEAVVKSVEEAGEDIAILSELLSLAGSKASHGDISKIFKAIGEKVAPFKKIEFEKIPVGGVKII
jgi:NADH-quinone oxidoreductase subunit G